ncbi:hypothetical protein [Candidatus Pantoea soli]|uniref:SH3 domain-containing protein n=1 Tax=Candidatus Pantoea soli TaxID=3098669 RepID=A0A518X9J5_9GAMM|nr:hypothetical protein [Pantoea soli]QDY40869.1 hypothetical protein D8B20_02645 [Pantoea soli]
MKWIPLFFIVFAASGQMAVSSEVVKNGTLQAYWLPHWHNNVNSPELLLRFSTDQKNSAAIIINISGVDKIKNFIAKEFSYIPDEFFKYKEGHVEQYGSLKFSGLFSTKECDARIYQATLISFTTQQTKKNFTDNGCDNYPWLITMMLRDGIQQAELHSEPLPDSEKVAVISSQTPLVKVRTVNQDWFYVANYDESQPELTGKTAGYIQSTFLEPVN